MANTQKTSNDAYFQAIFEHYQDRIPDITVNNFKQIEIEQKKAFEYWKQIPVEAPKKEEVKDNKSETVDSLLDKLLF